jgi:serine/threonine protein kinase
MDPDFNMDTELDHSFAEDQLVFGEDGLLRGSPGEAKGQRMHTHTHTHALMSSSPDQLQKKKSKSLRDFTMLKMLGKGSFGKVMLVKEKGTSRLYAMKVLDKQLLVAQNQVAHTNTERSIMGRAKHPFIVRLRYAFRTSKKLCFVTDFMPGGELFYHLGRAGRFSEQRAKLYAAEMVSALGYLHSRKIVYRDLKPENILLDKQGHVQITDFGLSKENVDGNDSAHSFCGTPEYLAPEVVTRSGHGRAADWWSFGSLLYEMMTGLPPFYSRDRERLFHKIMHAPLRLPRSITAEARDLLVCLLQRNPERRLGSSECDCLDIMRHPFFAEIDWDALDRREYPPSFVPNGVSLTDSKLHALRPDSTVVDDLVANFESDFTSEPIPNSIQVPHSIRGHSSSSSSSLLGRSHNSKHGSNHDDKFQNFTYVGST